MTPSELREARLRLGLTQEQLATLLGYRGPHLRQIGCDLEAGRMAIREPQRRLVEAYLAGYRTLTWPDA